MLDAIIKQYGLPDNKWVLKPFGNGLINRTWILESANAKYIVQKINDSIFPAPVLIEQNLHKLNQYFNDHFPGYLFVNPEETVKKNQMYFLQGTGYFRMFRFIEGSVTFDIANSAALAFEAARQFGKFTRLLADFDTSKLNITLPDFHNLTLRYQQFEAALLHGNAQRIEACLPAIAFIKEQKNILDTFNEMQCNEHFKKRVIHHDTKISNVLFDKNGKGLCVIDLDTVMPGYFISDVGDMIRTYLSPVSEEEIDFTKIEIRDEYFLAIVDGYLSEMSDELSTEEKKYFVYAGKFMIYMQAIRFLTDYINNDVYYGAKYEGHNLTRCNNQLQLLKLLLGKEAVLQANVDEYIINATKLPEVLVEKQNL